MIPLTDREIAEFWHRSFAAVDGLWFVKLEDRSGFDAALEVDNQVWKIMPKIQARMLKAMGHQAPGTEGLLECLTTKLSLDGFTCKIDKTEDESGFEVVIDRCPWHDLMVKSGREYLSGKVGDRICNTEYLAWASEFGSNIAFERGSQICKGSTTCVMRFLLRPDSTTRPTPKL